MRVLAALDKFRGSLSAAQACDIVAAAAQAAGAGWTSEACPLTDGGEGFAAILTRAAGGEMRSFTVEGPRGRPVRARAGLVPSHGIPGAARALMGLAPDAGAVAVVEMAEASGLALLEPGERDPLLASSFGTGQLIAEAARGAAAVVLGIGGSATHDLGLGALAALGLRCLDEDGRIVGRPTPSRWPDLRRMEGRIDAAIPPISIACDVKNPLLGPRGAVAIYAPQKGLRAQDASALEAGTARMAQRLCRHFGRPEELVSEPGAGAAGGLGFGLRAAGARLVPGFDLVAGWLDLDRRISGCDVVVTGEGRFDDSSLDGKGPGAVVRRALALGKPVQVLAGRVVLSREIPGVAIREVSTPELPLERAFLEAPRLLREAALGVFQKR